MSSPHAPPLHGSLPPEGADLPRGGPAAGRVSHATRLPGAAVDAPGPHSETTLGQAAEMTLGVMGGGQLGRMFVHAAQRMGFFTAVLDPDHLSPAGRVSHHHIQTAYTDPQGLHQLARHCVAVTTEFENVPASALEELARSVTVSPSHTAVAIAQDRADEKAHFAGCGVPVAPYAVIETPAQLAAIVAGDPSAAPGRPKQASTPLGGSEAHAVASVGADLFPGILKTTRMGYDGKGQVRVADRAALEAAWDSLRNVPCVLEKMLPLQLECSVIVARGADGTCVHLPVQRNLHRDGILAVTEVHEGNLPPTLVERAVAAAKSIAANLHYVGVLCVEFFVLDPSSPAAQALGGLVVNEMAPRPHNSGHYSIDACDVSQFELQVRTLANLPLTQPRQHSPAIMLNLLGDLWPGVADGGKATGTPPWDAVLALPGTFLHLYGKAQASKGRKMGHLTVTGASVEQVRATALQAAALLGIAAF